MAQTQSSIHQNTICREPDSFHAVCEYGPAYKIDSKTVNSFLDNMKNISLHCLKMKHTHLSKQP